MASALESKGNVGHRHPLLQPQDYHQKVGEFVVDLTERELTPLGEVRIGNGESEVILASQLGYPSVDYPSYFATARVKPSLCRTDTRLPPRRLRGGLSKVCGAGLGLVRRPLGSELR